MIFIWLLCFGLSFAGNTTSTNFFFLYKKPFLAFWRLYLSFLKSREQNQASTSSPFWQGWIQCSCPLRAGQDKHLQLAQCCRGFSPSVMTGSTFQPGLCEQSQRARSNRARIIWGFKAKLFPLKCLSTAVCQQHGKPWQKEIESFLVVYTPVAVGRAQWHTGKWSVPGKSTARRGCCLQSPGNRHCSSAGHPAPLLNTHLSDWGGFQSAWFLLGRVCPKRSFHASPCSSGWFWCFPEWIINSYRSRNVRAFLGKPLALYLNLFSGPTLAMWEKPTRLCLGSRAWEVRYSHMWRQ